MKMIGVHSHASCLLICALHVPPLNVPSQVQALLFLPLCPLHPFVQLGIRSDFRGYIRIVACF